MTTRTLVALFGIPALLTFPVAGALLLDAAFDLRLLRATVVSRKALATDPRWSHAVSTVHRQVAIIVLDLAVCAVAGANAFPISAGLREGLTVWGLIAVPWVLLALVVLDARGRRKRHRMRVAAPETPETPAQQPPGP